MALNEKTIFSTARQLSDPAERTAYLDLACGDNADLRVRIERLLHAERRADEFLGDHPLELSSGDGETILAGRLAEGPGTVIGRYKLLQRIGEGGFGVVYMAEQSEPVRRRVALKIIKLGMDTRQVVARFEAERQALAMMDHPNIARVLDGGATETGRPYFVMELVQGVPITQFCDQNKLKPHDRLRLLIQVCHAIQSAHQKGIIHRDIKPSNVLVTLEHGEPMPKVIDFGIAKATHQKLTDKTLFTQYATMIGTPAYMSPEQAEMSSLDVDTRTDVYALGVLLYELLTGTTPFPEKRLRSLCYSDMQRVIMEEEPERPSTRLSTMAHAEKTSVALSRGEELGSLRKLLMGDLDWVVMKCLEKDRRRRYDTASDLAMDVQRHLDNEPVRARPPSTVYRLQKAWRRNKALYIAGGAVVLALIAALVFAFIANVARLRQLENALAAKRAQEEHDRLLQVQQRQQQAREVDIPQIRQLLALEHLVPAFARARAIRAILPDDPTAEEIWKQLVTNVTIATQPPGARVFLRDWNVTNKDEQWLELGLTPLRGVDVPWKPATQIYSGETPFRWRFVNDGYQPRELVASIEQITHTNGLVMHETANAPEGMVFMPGAGAKEELGKLEEELGDFWIDRFEVTNRQFQQFIDEGGYGRREYWKHEFVQEGKIVPWEEATRTFRDRTGKPGPALWSNGRFLEGEENYPVQGVSWYEAAAYAEFAGKSLPTIYHWAWAADLDEARYIVPFSNFSSRGPAPVGHYTAIGRFDVSDMAGNVKEWCWNEAEAGRRCLRGAAWDDPSYLFGQEEARSPFERAPQFGFRCVRYLKTPTAQIMSPIRSKGRDFAAETRASRAQIEEYLRHYSYFRDAPLNARPQSKEEKDGSIHEVVRIDSAYGPQFDVHLFGAPGGHPPYAPLVIVPESTAFNRNQRLWPLLTYTGQCVARLIQEGRLICWPVYSGTFERHETKAKWGSSEHRDEIVRITKDLSRAIDYLQDRNDTDMSKLTFLSPSWGAMMAPMMLVAEPRFKAAVLVTGGYSSDPIMPEVDPFQFAPYVKTPVLMINGLYDRTFLHELQQIPLKNDLPNSELKVLESGHAVPLDEVTKLVDEWLRQKFHTAGSPLKPSDGRPQVIPFQR